MINVDSQKMLIEITRGDTGKIAFGAKDNEGNDYVPVAGDKLKFSVAKDFGKEPLFYVEHTMENDVISFWTVTIEPSHTKSLKFDDYVFDVQLTTSSGIDTIIGKTDTVSPTFRVWGEVS